MYKKKYGHTSFLFSIVFISLVTYQLFIFDANYILSGIIILSIALLLNGTRVKIVDNTFDEIFDFGSDNSSFKIVSMLLVVFLICYIGVTFQNYVYESGMLGMDSGIFDEIYRNLFNGEGFSAGATQTFVPNDANGARFPLYEVGETSISFNTVHYSPSMIFFMFFRRLFDDYYNGQLIALVVWEAIAVIPAYLLLHSKGYKPLEIIFFILVLFVGPIGSGNIVNVPHGVTLSVPFLLFSLYFLSIKNTPLYLLTMIITIGFQESIAIFYLGIAVFLLLENEKRNGIITLFLSMLLFVLGVKLTKYYIDLYSVNTDRELWDSIAFGEKAKESGGVIASIIKFAVTEPFDFFRTVFNKHAIEFFILTPVFGLFIFLVKKPSLIFVYIASCYSQILLGASENEVGRGTIIYEYHWHYVFLLIACSVFVLSETRVFIKSKFIFYLLFSLPVFILSNYKYGQWFNSNYWFSSSNLAQIKRMPTNIFPSLPNELGIVATTNRPAIGIAANHRVFALDYWAVPHSDWPEIDAAVIPNDFGGMEEWTLGDGMENAYLVRRSILENKGFKCVNEDLNYELWLPGKDVLETNCTGRLERTYLSESAFSHHELLSDEKGFYRKATSDNRTLVFGPYQEFIPSENTQIFFDVGFDNYDKNTINENDYIFTFNLIRDEEVIFSHDVRFFELDSHLNIPQSLIKNSGNYQVQLVSSEKYVNYLKFYKLAIVGEDSILDKENTFFLRLSSGVNELPFYMPSGTYQILEGSQFIRIDDRDSEQSKFEYLDGGYYFLKRGENKAKVINVSNSEQLIIVKLLKIIKE